MDDGRELPLQLAHWNNAEAGTRSFVLTQASETLTFINVDHEPVPSLLRGFSAPVIVDVDYTDAQLLTLLARDGWPAYALAGPVLALSARTGEGLAALRRTLLEIAGWQAAPEGVFIARERHLRALRAVDEHLQQAQAQIDARVPALDLLAEELRLAQNALNTITGEFGADDLLGVIFSQFCIGK